MKALIEKFDTRFADFQNKDSTFTIFARPMDADGNNVPENLQMEVIELHFYKFYLVEGKYTNLHAFSRTIICLLGLHIYV
jgi:hypothetical protein